MEPSKIDQVCAIADRIDSELGHKKLFAMYISEKEINLTVKITNKQLQYGIFDYKIEKRLRRDIPIINQRVSVSEILAECSKQLFV